MWIADSKMLSAAAAHVYDWLGFGEVGDEVFRDLVIARIVEPTSKIDALRVLADLGRHWCRTRPLTATSATSTSARPATWSPRNALSTPVIAEACHC